MDAIAHTQVSGFCLVTLAVLLRGQQKKRGKKLPRGQVTALLWVGGAPTIVDYGSRSGKGRGGEKGRTPGVPDH